LTVDAFRPLPGVRVEARTPAPPEVLPRMDVPAFVGFAAAGPLHTPVAVEDAARFADVFGEDAPLAWDDARGEPLRALLGPSVRAFFHNGGRRCWVVRVAGPGASSNRFPVPGLTRRDATAAPKPAVFHARSEGRWSDRVQVATLLQRERLALRATSLPALTFDAGEAGPELRPGDLLRLQFPGSRLQLLCTVATVGRGAARSSRIAIDQPVWLRQGPPPSGTEGWAWLFTADGVRVRIRARVPAGAARGGPVLVAAEGAPAPAPSSLLTFTNRSGCWLVAVEDPGPQSRTRRLEITGEAFLALRGRPAPMPAPGGAVDAERLTFDMLTRDAGGRVVTLANLGFDARHPRWVGALPTDAELFADDDDHRSSTDWAGLLAEVAAPRFALAAQAGDTPLYLPLGMPELWPVYAGPLRPARDPLARDGLARFGIEAFLDAGMRAGGPARPGGSVFTLLARADYLRYQSPSPRPLTGIHAALAVEEATMVAVPDAVHPGWEARARRPRPVERPEPPQDPTPPADGRFERCTRPVPAPPRLSATTADPTGSFALTWSASEGATAYTIQESPGPAFDSPTLAFRGPARRLELRERPRGIYHFRARAEGEGVSSQWSESVAVPVAPAPRVLVIPRERYRDGVLVAAQLALLRMCAARGDLLALLSLPEHYREREAAAHPARLLAGGPPAAGQDELEPALDPAETHALGYGALYHPWPIGPDSETSERLRAIPPDGPAAGVAAHRAATRGAWVAPANEPLRDTVWLTPAIPPAAYGLLQNAQLNLVRQEPAGFVWLNADTLAADPDLRPLNVRRLLSLLRRLAMLHGPTWVFEPNDEALRRRIRRELEAVLIRLFELGAFAGRTPDESFQVTVDRGAGETSLVVELKVAPSQPLRFLTVRLVHSGDQGLRLEGV
jgi:hypothetical protein